MDRINIYYNKKGQLVAGFYEHSDDGEYRCVGIVKGEKVYDLFEEFSKAPISKILVPRKNQMVFAYESEECIINITNVEKVYKDERIKEYVDKTKKEDLRRRIIEARDRTVERINKHSGAVVSAALILSVVLTLAISTEALSDRYDAIFSSPESISTVLETPLSNKQEYFQTPSTNNYYEEYVVPPKTDEVIINQEETKEEYAYLEYTDRSNAEKLLNASINYYDIIEKYANTYGLDPELVLALATQERGVHSTITDRGGGTGLMQIQNSIWEGNSVRAFNYDANRYETYEVTDARIKDVDTNIKIGCMILQDMIRAKDYNILAGVLSYNMGGRSVNSIINAYSNKTGLTRDEILSNQNDCSWLQERGVVNIGDSHYLEHVLSYMGDSFKTYVMKPGENGIHEKVEVTVRNSHSKEVTR